MADPTHNPFDRVVGPWEHVMEDMQATAERHRDAGRTVIELHPGDVGTLTGEPRTAAERQEGVDLANRRLGFDVVVPGDEYERLERALADRSVERYEVFRAEGAGMVFLLVDVRCGEDCAVLIPAYYDQNDRGALERIARDHGLQAHVRPLSADTIVTIDFDDPGPFFPD